MYAKKQSWEGREGKKKSGGVGEGGEGGEGGGESKESRRVALWAVDCKTINVLSGPLVLPCLQGFPSLALGEVGSHSANSHLFLPSSMLNT